MLVQSVILLFELKHFGRVPLFKRFCHLLFAALLYDSTEPSYFGMPRVGPFLCLLHCHRLKILASVESKLALSLPKGSALKCVT